MQRNMSDTQFIHNGTERDYSADYSDPAAEGSTSAGNAYCVSFIKGKVIEHVVDHKPTGPLRG